ncbi:MAG TPA: M28 family peptidase [Candidatus Hypogeohydataceae bacterium YC41]
MKYDPNEALRDVKALSIPRRTGSPGEIQAQNYIIQRFKAIGIEPREEAFSFNPVLGLISKGFLLIVLLLLTALRFLSPFYPLLGIILCFTILILVVGFIWGKPVVALVGWVLFKDIPFLRKLRSKNIMATWPVGGDSPALSLRGTESRSNLPISTGIHSGLLRFARNDQEDVHVYILAHYDSKSQSLPLGIRIPLVMVLFVSVLFLVAYYFLSFWACLPLLGTFERVSFTLALTSGLTLFFTRTRNSSPGAIDNASGVAVMLQLAEAIKKEVQGFKGSKVQKFKGLKFHFVATGAEEEGLVGAFWLCESVGAYCSPRRICLRHDNTPLQKNHFFINLDGVGTKGRIYCTSKTGLHPSSQKQKELLSLIEEAAENEGLKVYSPPLVIGAMADHFPFVARGYNAVTFSTVSRRSLWVHTAWDAPEVVESEGMERVGKLILAVLAAY